MTIFRGNVGNLLQHWVFCEILAVWQGCANRVDFIDAYSMAPLADERYPESDIASRRRFDWVQANLMEEQTPYERAWHRLTPDADRYPNSAAFLTEVWQGDYSLVLCESDASTVRELRRWQTKVEVSPRCIGLEIADVERHAIPHPGRQTIPHPVSCVSSTLSDLPSQAQGPAPVAAWVGSSCPPCARGRSCSRGGRARSLRPRGWGRARTSPSVSGSR